MAAHNPQSQTPVGALEVAFQLLDDLDTDLWLTADTAHLNRNCHRIVGGRTPTHLTADKFTTALHICGVCRRADNAGLMLHNLVVLARTAFNQPAYNDLLNLVDVLNHTAADRDLHTTADAAAQVLTATQHGLYDNDPHTAVAARLQTAADLRDGGPLHQQLQPLLPRTTIQRAAADPTHMPSNLTTWNWQQLTAIILRHGLRRNHLIDELAEELTWLADRLNFANTPTDPSFVQPAATMIADHHDMLRSSLATYENDQRQVLCCLLDDIPVRMPADGMTPAAMAALRTPTLAAAARNSWDPPWFCVLPWPVAVAAARAAPTRVAAVQQVGDHTNPAAFAATATQIAANHNLRHNEEFEFDPSEFADAARNALDTA